MRVHVLGVCGTFMGGVAQLARALGDEVSGSDVAAWPPMGGQLARAGIPVREGYDPAHLEPPPDLVVIGNALSRGNPAVEHVLDAGLPYVSGPQWLAERVLRGREVIAVAGTHGKTTTASLVAWILERAGLAPGFLIGGVPAGFGVSARLGAGRHFVIEADEYDTAFFDKRAKFVHYRPRIAVLNNLEHDHADIYPDLAAIQRQFHHLVRTVPRGGRILAAAGEAALDEVLAMGCWTPVERYGVEAEGAEWSARLAAEDGSHFAILHRGGPVAEVAWRLRGRHNVHNALAAVAATAAAGVPAAEAARALEDFAGVRRRLERIGEADGVAVYDDFAHHPTAIAATLAALRAAGGGLLVAVLEPRSNTMRMGVHREALAGSLAAADAVVAYAPPDLGWDLAEALAPLGTRARVAGSIEAVAEAAVAAAAPGARIVVMSNGDFGGVHGRILEGLRARAGASRRAVQRRPSRHAGGEK